MRCHRDGREGETLDRVPGRKMPLSKVPEGHERAMEATQSAKARAWHSVSAPHTSTSHTPSPPSMAMVPQQALPTAGGEAALCEGIGTHHTTLGPSDSVGRVQHHELWRVGLLASLFWPLHSPPQSPW